MDYRICAYLLGIGFVISLMLVYWLWRRVVYYRDMLDSQNLDLLRKGLELDFTRRHRDDLVRECQLWCDRVATLRKSIRSLTLCRDICRFRQVGVDEVSYKNGCKIIDSIYEVF